MLEFFVGAGLGALYVEVLYRLFKKGTSLALFTYPLRIFIFAIIMGMFLAEGSLIKTIPLMGGFLFGFLLNTFLRGFRKLGAFKLS
jgi:4-hydroxybenzoate polyprenyltransferase